MIKTSELMEKHGFYFVMCVCMHVQVKVKLPNTDYKDVELDVTETFFDCRTSEQ